MKFSIASTLLAAVTAVSASPLEYRDVRTVDFIFHATAASYNLTIPANGEFYETGHSDLNINIIDTPNFNALTQCSFTTPTSAALVNNFAADGTTQIVIGPPQPVTAVKCWGTCVPIYSNCYINGQLQGACCSGYCAANKCRPFPVAGTK